MTLMPSYLRAPRRLLSAALAIVLVILAALAPRALSHPFHPGASVPDTSAPGLTLKRVGGDFNLPVYVTSPAGDTARQFVVDLTGRIRIIKNGQTLGRPFLDIRGSVTCCGEGGLLSMAFAPDYATSGLFYVFYTDRGGDLRLEEFRRSGTDPDLAVHRGRRTVLVIEHSAYNLHYGGQLQYGPGGLYVSTGDGGGPGDPLRSGQSLNTLLGKILRIDPRRPTSRRGYSVPRSNPFVGRFGRNEIWHYGLRNPWRFSFDRANGDMSIGDVGARSVEEVDFVINGRRGANFGWSCFEGTRPYWGCSAPGHRPPVLQYTHEGDSCAVTGGYVLRDPRVPRLYGRYIYGDYCTGAIHAATLHEGGATSNTSLGLIVPRLTSFGEDAQGRLYMTSISYGGRRGAVYRLRATP